jgi:hypothetical protein
MATRDQASSACARSTRTSFANLAPARTKGHQVGSDDCPPAGLGGLDHLEHHRQGRGRAAGARVTLVRSLTVAKVDSIGLMVRRWGCSRVRRCPAGSRAGSSLAGRLAHIAALKQQARDVLTLGDHDSVLIHELCCAEPGCPPVESVVAVLSTDGSTRRWHVHRPQAAFDGVALLAAFRTARCWRARSGRPACR